MSTTTITPESSKFGFTVTSDTYNNFEQDFVQGAKFMEIPVIGTLAKEATRVAVLAAAVFVDLFLNIGQALKEAALFVSSPITCRVALYCSKKDDAILTPQAESTEASETADAPVVTPQVESETAVESEARIAVEANRKLGLTIIRGIVAAVVVAGIAFAAYQYFGAAVPKMPIETFVEGPANVFETLERNAPVSYFVNATVEPLDYSLEGYMKAQFPSIARRFWV